MVAPGLGPRDLQAGGNMGASGVRDGERTAFSSTNKNKKQLLPDTI